MTTLSINVKYRPVRIGWCIRHGNLEDYRKALKLTHTLWGGKFNPLIPVEDESFARQMVSLFQVDALYPIAEDRNVQKFIGKFPYLPWPEIHNKLFIDGINGKVANFLDICHPIRFFYNDHVKNQVTSKNFLRYFYWEKDNPISDILLSTVGAIPSAEDIGIDYQKLIEKFIPTAEWFVDNEKPIPSEIWGKLTINDITSYRLHIPRTNNLNNSGFYIGDVSNFDDLLYYWNLRAAGIELLFYDFNHAKQLNFIRDKYLEELEKRPSSKWERENVISIWACSDKQVDLSEFGKKIVRCSADRIIFNGFNIKPTLVFIDEESVLGSVDEDDENPTVTFQLPEKPFFDDIKFHTQHLIATISPIIDVSYAKDYTFRPPFIPELNEYYGRNFHFFYNEVRAEKNGIGIVINTTQEHLSLRALKFRNLIEKIFEVFGIKAEPSQAGLICNQLIKQMGGLQECRVFKIKGVRELIAKYNPDQTFTRSAAIQIIGNFCPSSRQPRFEDYENLFIERRNRGKLKPEHAFIYLLKHGVFRVGLKFNCPSCQLEFWQHIDNVKTTGTCEYCGNQFNITPQLKDRDWAYRRSGLFGKDDHQEGGIPVALTLQQLHTTLRWHPFIYCTAMKLSPISVSINPCETDFVVVTQNHDGRVQIVIGECKTHKKIEQSDVQNLTRVADALSKERLDVFILFSKLQAFTDDEIELCKSAQDKYRFRVILLTNRELEPYFIYEKTAKEFQIRKTATSLADLAQATYDIYFDPKLRNK